MTGPGNPALRESSSGPNSSSASRRPAGAFINISPASPRATASRGNGSPETDARPNRTVLSPTPRPFPDGDGPVSFPFLHRLLVVVLVFVLPFRLHSDHLFGCGVFEYDKEA